MTTAGLLLRLLLAAILYLFPDLFIISSLRTAFRPHEKKAVRLYWRIDIGLLIIACIAFYLLRFLDNGAARFDLYIFGVFFSFIFTKVLLLIPLITELIARLFFSVVTVSSRKKKKPDAKFLAGRRKFIAQASLLLGAIPFSGYIYGMIRGKYDFRIHKQEIFFPELPQAFDGFTITQISDLHVGSFDKFAKHILENCVDKILSLQSDILFFTGDVVNSRATEMDGWYDVFSKLNSPMGVYSILGNHDYGDYAQWPSEEAKAENLQKVKNIHRDLNLRLLLNEHTTLERNGEKIYLTGVENWGKGGFQKFGDIHKAAEGIPFDAFHILLSHDPSYWDAGILKEEYPPHLTLSGHTHGFQMGIETQLFRFSPSRFVYKQWAGLYQTGKHFIYVNRGLGTVGYPGRIGIWPEITQITLRRNV